MIVALIAARGGSKGILKKSLAKVGGKTLITRALESAIGSRHIERIIFSSDDPLMLDEASGFNDVILSSRPAHLSDDFANIYDVARYEVDQHGIHRPFHLVILQPTTPFRTSADIDELIERMLESGAKSGMAVTPVDYPVEWMFDLHDDGLINEKIFQRSISRRQDARKAYKPSGSVYVLTHEVLGNLEGILPSCDYGCATIEVESLRALNIDTPEQLVIANLFAEAWGW